MSEILSFFSEWKNMKYFESFVCFLSEWITYIATKGKVSKSFEALLKNSTDNII